VESGHKLWNIRVVTIGAQERPFSAGERLALLVTRVLTATLLTALVIALENWLYELFFAPDLYAMGNPFARGVFLFAVSFPYILIGLIVLGLPTAYALGRFQVESVLTYGVAGLFTGALWGVMVLGSHSYGIANAASYGCVCALFWWWLRPRV
jgi:hypothetical protein